MATIGTAMTVTAAKIGRAFPGIRRNRLVAGLLRGENARSLKGVVVYYSATGSTAKIANAIYKGIRTVIDCDVAPVKKLRPKDMDKYDLVVMGSPIWYNREVASLKIFTNEMPRMDGKYFALFCTHGVSPYNIFWSMSRNLLRKGMSLIGWNDWYGDVTHVIRHAIPYITHGHPDNIDLYEAEVFGRQIAENATKIDVGQTELIPEIPMPAEGEEHLFTPKRGQDGRIRFAEGPPDSVPKINFRRCAYPRCTECIDNCPVNALDFSLMTTAGLADSPIAVQEACNRCGGLCQRVCCYDAISYVSEKDTHVIDMKKCAYPQCTLCADECVASAIDFSQSPPKVHNRCEGCDVCWCICPHDAISIPDVEEIHNNKAWWYRIQSAEAPGKAGGSGSPPNLKQGSAPGFAMSVSSPRFRQLVPAEEIGKQGKPMYSKKVPRIVLDKREWPYHINEGK
jgi:flavodoxin/ferredoxin